MTVGIVGVGFVGGSLVKSFTLKGIENIVYDRYKNGGIGSLEKILETYIVFLCLPTLYSEEKGEYEKTAIHEVCSYLDEKNYRGLVVLKSTIEPETTDKLSEIYNLRITHNPEFLTARTAFEDFHNQKHIVLGKGRNCDDDDMNLLSIFYSKHYPDAKITVGSSLETESMKIFCNSYYASKVMLFNEYYLLCQKNGSNFEKIKEMMLKNGWINKMHTDVPGPDGSLGYGGACFPKDTNALCKYMEKKGTEKKVLEAVIEECSEVRICSYGGACFPKDTNALCKYMEKKGTEKRF